MAKFEIRVENLNKKRKVSDADVKRLCLFALKKIKRQAPLKLNVIFYGNRAIKKLNRIYKGVDKPTDVLCFCLKDGLTDIYISSDMAYSVAGAYKNTYKKELYLYVTHGILHMAGYRDDTEKARKKMIRLGEEILDSYEK